jgi:hypothetical protein
MEKIQIYDNFFSEKIFIEINKFFINNNWDNFSLININSHLNIKIGINNFDKPFYKIDLNNQTFFTDTLKKIIEEKMKKNLNLLRVYAVAQCYEQNSNYHTDSNLSGTSTFTYYINNYNKGELLIKIPNEKYIIAIKPHENMGVFFPSFYYHKANGVNDGLRICIAWKFQNSIN